MVFAHQFEYNNQLSDDWGLMLCAIDSGGSEEVSSGLEITPVTDELHNRIIDYGVKDETNLNFEITLIHKNNQNEMFNRDEIREITQWLLTPNIHWLKLYDMQYEDYWCLGRFTKISKFKMNGLIPALILTFTSVSNYYYSKVIKRSYTVNGASTIDIRNYGDEIEGYIYPNMILTNHLGNMIQIKNTVDQNAFLLSDLEPNEIVTIDGHNLIVYSNTSTSSGGIKTLGDSFNRNWLKLYRGKNILEMNGDFDVTFEYREARRIGEF